MRILAYSHRSDETAFFKAFTEKYQVEVVLCDDAPSMETAYLAKGFDCISIITTIIDEALIQKFLDLGVKYISTRTIGYDHIDVGAARRLGMHVGNATYSANSVADYTIMLMLMATRRMKAITTRAAGQDFSLKGVQGRELPNLTVGVLGTGRIGRTVVRHLSGFGCDMLAYDLYENDEVKKYARYAPLDEIIRTCDILSLHMPATEDNYHLISDDTIARMKDGAYIINTARGSLIDTDALIRGIESGKLAGAALDVIEHEAGLYYNDLKGQVLSNRGLAVLKSFPNVIVTPHTAFYTDQAVSDMVENSIRSCIGFINGTENPWLVV